MKIVYLSTSKIPTEKAYGVTVLETANAAKAMGIDFFILSPSENRRSTVENHIILRAINPRIILRISKSNRLKQVIFAMNSVYIPLQANLNSNFRSASIYWTRDPLSALILSFIKRNKPILLELHHLPEGIGLTILKTLKTRKDIHFAAISNKLADGVQAVIGNTQIIICPMAVPREFISRNSNSFPKELIRLIYVGKGQSSGYDNGLITLIHNFKETLKNYPKITLTFLGLESNFKTALMNEVKIMKLNPASFIFLDHQPHSEVAKILASCHIGLLPYPKNKYNEERFPIKSLEYAAAGLAILASNIESHLRIIGSECSWFYDPSQDGSFNSQIDMILTDQNERNRKIKNAQVWAEDFSYERRIQVVTTYFDSILKTSG
jgi:glycosyltransferase involved in cell wall biosynthesis